MIRENVLEYFEDFREENFRQVTILLHLQVVGAMAAMLLILDLMRIIK